MQRHGETDISKTQLDTYGDGDDAPTRQHEPKSTELDRYEDDEVVTAPWGPRVG
jgi:hypothetical protein